MNSDPASHTRRIVLKGGLAACAAAAAPAHAAPRLGYPLGLLYGRIGPDGFERIDTAEQALWSSMAVRLGGLVSRIEPIQRFTMLTNDPPALQSENGNVLIARQIALEADLDHLLLYSSYDGRRSYEAYSNWLSQAYTAVRTRLSPNDKAIAEAHVLNVSGGPPIMSLSLDAPPKSRFNPFDLHRDPERQVMQRLAKAVERDIQSDAGVALHAETSIGR